MKTVELFAGIGGFRLAADARQMKTLWAGDVCPKACLVYRDRFGDQELREGDIRDCADEVPSHDLLTAGFPCQPFSSAGKKRGVRDPRGTLFEVIVNTIRRHKPEYFLLENVKRLLTMERGFHFATILSSLAELNYRIEWRLLNAMNFGLPQNRQRIFLMGHQHRSFREGPRLATKNELGSLLADQIEVLNDCSLWGPIERHGSRFPSWGIAEEGRFFAADLEALTIEKPRVTLHAVMEKDAPQEFDFTDATRKWLADNTPVNRFIQGVEILSNQGGGARMGYTIFGVNGVAPTLTSTTSRHYERYKVGDRYRRLTNVEYARIQGFPDDHCRAVSVYDQYALFGNAVPPPMAGWVMDRIGLEGVRPEHIFPKDGQYSLFNHAFQRGT